MDVHSLIEFHTPSSLAQNSSTINHIINQETKLKYLNFSDNWPSRSSPFIQAYDFEVFNIPAAINIFLQARPVAIAICLLYVVSAFVGREMMKRRERFALSRALLLWNISLAAFFIFGFLRSFPELFYILSRNGVQNGLYESVCTTDVHNYATAFWGMLFCLSKFVELGDTAFIILRKQKLIFLHWYHHTSVLLLCWFGFGDYETTSFRCFGTMNYFIHSLMYTYYALKALKVKVPRNFAMVLTVLQISQMMVGLFINVYTYNIKMAGGYCARELSNIFLSLFIYGTYFALFLNFFIKAYFVQPKVKLG